MYLSNTNKLQHFLETNLSGMTTNFQLKYQIMRWLLLLRCMIILGRKLKDQPKATKTKFNKINIVQMVPLNLLLTLENIPTMEIRCNILNFPSYFYTCALNVRLIYYEELYFNFNFNFIFIKET